MAVLGASAEARAQLAASPDFEEIVVTARKRDEALQRVPISITAFGPSDLARLGVTRIEDLKIIAPSVYIQESPFRQDTLNVTLRGLRNFAAADGIQYDTAGAVYKDGVYLARTQGLGGTLFDVDTVQVLKGPQGTLVGRNATGGAILYTTKEPEDRLGGYLDLTAGDYDTRKAQGALNIPLASGVALRAALSYDRREGYLKNLYFDPASGYRNDTAALGYSKIAGQFSVKFEPRDDIKLVLRGDFAGEHDTGSSYHDLGVFTGTLPSLGRPSICNIPGTCNGFTDLLGHTIAPASYNALLNSAARQANDFWTTDSAVGARDVGHYRTVSATADKRFGDLDVKWLAGYRWYDSSGLSISRGLPYDVAQFSFGPPSYQAYTSELTLNGRGLADRLNWTAGLFYFGERANGQGMPLFLFSPNNSAPRAITGQQITYTDSADGTGRNESYAAYAQASYALRPDLRLTAGARFTIDERFAHIATTSLRFPASAATSAAIPGAVFNPGSYVLNGIAYSGTSTACALIGPDGALLPLDRCRFDISKEFQKPTWTLSIDHDLFDKTMAYFTARSGYRAGAINSNANDLAHAVAQPEDVQDYEIGIKSEWRIAGVPVRGNLAAYLTDYRDLQVQASLPFVLLATAPGTGPGGATGPCTQAAFNAGSCSNTKNLAVAFNAKSAQIYGGEWDFQIRPLQQLKAGWSGSYLHAYYTNFVFSTPAGYLLPASGVTDLSGTPFPLPQYMSAGFATLDFTGEELGGAPVEDVSLTARWNWQSDFRGDFRGFNAFQKAKGYAMWDFRLDIHDVGQRNVSVGVFVTNAFNKAACQPEDGSSGAGGAGALNSAPNASFGVPNTSGVLQCVPLPPRMFGVSAGYRF